MRQKLVSLLIVASGILGAYLVLEDETVIVVIAMGSALVIISLAVALGFNLLSRHPVVGGWLLEAVTAGRWVLGSIATAVLLWLAIEVAPGDESSPQAKELWAAASAAVGALVTAWLVEPTKEEEWNLLKKATEKKFANRFEKELWDSTLDAKLNAIRGDAASAIMNDPPSTENAKYPIEEGWAWGIRRNRMRLIQIALREHTLWTTPPLKSQTGATP
ncbi:MAG: hypothetical protein LC776_06165 [Acidobacteria bacterium]|nr:hypothetical protein [Acidobacteriota bacterium]